MEIQQLSKKICLLVEGYSGLKAVVRPAQKEDFEALENDLSEDDRLELGSTWRRDWRTELHATMANSRHALIGRMEGLPGFVVFGNTEVTRDVDLVWMLQSASFAEAARAALGPKLAYIFKQSIRAVMNAMLQEKEAVINFIPVTQTRNIRWLRQQGFEFYGSPTTDYDGFVMFGMGPLMPALSLNERLWEAMLG